MVPENAIPLGTKLIAGGCVFALQTLGVDPAPVFWAAVGATIGVVTMRTERDGQPLPRMSMRTAITLFVAVVLACSLLAVWVSVTYGHDNDTNRKAIACAAALVFYLVWNVLAARIPQLLNALFDAAPGWLAAWIDRRFPGSKS